MQQSSLDINSKGSSGGDACYDDVYLISKCFNIILFADPPKHVPRRIDQKIEEENYSFFFKLKQNIFLILLSSMKQSCNRGWYYEKISGECFEKLFISQHGPLLVRPCFRSSCKTK